MTPDSTVAAETPWSTGRLDGRRRPKRILFGQMFEDAEIECAAFRPAARVFCIASAGCTALRLSHDHDVVACDINPAQLAYARRRSAGGPMETGIADRVLHLVRILSPLVGWRIALLRAFLSLDDPAEQRTFWRKHLDTRRFRTTFDAMLSLVTLRAVYSPQFLNFLPAHFGAVLRARLQRGFARHANATNPYAHALLLGETVNAVSQSARPSHIQFVCADAASYLESCTPNSFDAFTLSNILDGASRSYRDRLFRAVRRAARPDAAIVLRSFAEPPAGLATNLASTDRALLWGIVTICRLHEAR